MHLSRKVILGIALFSFVFLTILNAQNATSDTSSQNRTVAAKSDGKAAVPAAPQMKEQAPPRPPKLRMGRRRSRSLRSIPSCSSSRARSCLLLTEAMQRRWQGCTCPTQLF